MRERVREGGREGGGRGEGGRGGRGEGGGGEGGGREGREGGRDGGRWREREGRTVRWDSCMCVCLTDLHTKNKK